MTIKKIRVLLVDDSVLMLTMLKRIVNNDPRLEVVATAKDGVEALECLHKYKPDVMCTDYHMPRMDGLALTKQVMRDMPLPILVVSISVSEDQQHNVISLLNAGALDVFSKPQGGAQLNSEQAIALCNRIYLLSKVRAIRRFVGTAAERAQATPPSTPSSWPSISLGNKQVVVIGGSTGGPQAFHALLSKLPAQFPLPVLCVQHISIGFTESLVQWLNASCAIRVKIATHGEPLCPGVVYFPPDDHHLLLGPGRLYLDNQSPPVNRSRPSVDRLFDSACQHSGANAIGVLLSGMGRDGADGLSHMHAMGAFTLAQSEESCVIFGMPGEAVKLGAADMVMAPQDMAPLIVQAAKATNGALA